MKKSIRRCGAKLVFSQTGIALCRGICGRQCKLLRWDEVAAVGYFVWDMSHTDITIDCVSLYPATMVNAREYQAPNLFVYFSVFAPAGFGYDDVLPVFREGRNICFNLGGGEPWNTRGIEKTAENSAAIISNFYGGKIINRNAVYHK